MDPTDVIDRLATGDVVMILAAAYALGLPDELVDQIFGVTA